LLAALRSPADRCNLTSLRAVIENAEVIFLPGEDWSMSGQLTRQRRTQEGKLARPHNYFRAVRILAAILGGDDSVGWSANGILRGDRHYPYHNNKGWFYRRKRERHFAFPRQPLPATHRRHQLRPPGGGGSRSVGPCLLFAKCGEHSRHLFGRCCCEGRPGERGSTTKLAWRRSGIAWTARCKALR
jgi:hypothetical protein